MRIITLSVSMLVILAITVVGAATAKTPRPTLGITAMAPLAIQGKAFRANEKVTLLVTAGGMPIRAKVRTGSLGGFRHVFSYRLAKCTGISIQAIGSRGSRAMLSLDQPHCAPSTDASSTD
jgi:hypothetical protein